jgi:hypothetical protein
VGGNNAPSPIAPKTTKKSKGTEASRALEVPKDKYVIKSEISKNDAIKILKYTLDYAKKVANESGNVQSKHISDKIEKAEVAVSFIEENASGSSTIETLNKRMGAVADIFGALDAAGAGVDYTEVPRFGQTKDVCMAAIPKELAKDLDCIIKKQLPAANGTAPRATRAANNPQTLTQPQAPVVPAPLIAQQSNADLSHISPPSNEPSAAPPVHSQVTEKLSVTPVVAKETGASFESQPQVSKFNPFRDTAKGRKDLEKWYANHPSVKRPIDGTGSLGVG